MITVEGEEVAAFIEKKLGVTISKPYIALGFLTNDKRPLSAFVFNDHTGANIEMTAFAELGGITRGVARYIARYVFEQLGCRRLTVRTKKRNKRVLQLAPRYGFKYEGVAKHFYADDDAVVFRMLKSECPWL
jgi:hypothetical protein